MRSGTAPLEAPLHVDIATKRTLDTPMIDEVALGLMQKSHRDHLLCPTLARRTIASVRKSLASGRGALPHGCGAGGCDVRFQCLTLGTANHYTAKARPNLRCRTTRAEAS